MRIKIVHSLFCVGFLISLLSCKNDKVLPREYEAKNVIVVVVDGARYSETWGDVSRQFIPRMDSILSLEGVINTQFYNEGETFTTPGHVAITTGFYQGIDNSGGELPSNASFFQTFLKQSGLPATRAWLVTSKDKLQVLANSSHSDWFNVYCPSTYCGVNGAGIGSGYREDSITFEVAKDVLTNYQPKLLLINFREPDYSGHQGNWNAYLNGIKSSDEYVYKLWKWIQNNSYYQGKTAFFVTNDHGRHLDNIGGFTSHGDGCAGCRHLFFYAYGPDFKSSSTSVAEYDLTDLHATVLELLGVQNSHTSGEVMKDIFK